MVYEGPGIARRIAAGSQARLGATASPALPRRYPVRSPPRSAPAPPLPAAPASAAALRHRAGEWSAPPIRARPRPARDARARAAARRRAFATLLALTVVEPQSSGIGGGGFLVYQRRARRRVDTYDGREDRAAAATPTWFFGADGSRCRSSEAIPGGKSVGVPGNIR
jgi:gamma-glutamyltranspeptidase/glutathione hydrolase